MRLNIKQVLENIKERFSSDFVAEVQRKAEDNFSLIRRKRNREKAELAISDQKQFYGKKSKY